MDGQSVKRVVVAGGGTAGWIAAATLSKLLGPLLEITLVESEEIGTVGVGEATIPTHRTYHHLMGIDERDFMRATRATFKLGIGFENWARPGDRYIHSFGTLGKSTWMADFHHIWLEGRRQGLAGELGEYCFEHQAAEAGRFATSDKARINYAYHLDASLYAGFLRGIAEAHGVKRVEGKIAEVVQDGETGFIEALVLERGERVEGDLFIDCTGFRGLLIEQALKTGYEDWGHWLPTDAAWAVQTQSTGEVLPYTRSIAGEAGWQWRIPLQHRVGNGMVFCSQYMEPDTAREVLLNAVEGETLTEPRLIRYRTGRRRRVWNRNCIALGLASGFVEPLESTSIHLIQTTAIRLVQNFPFAGIHDALTERFNEQSRIELEQIRDFIVLHYRLNERADAPFWQHCASMDIPETLARRIALFEENGIAYQAPDELFRVDSWLQVMLGQRLEPYGHHLLGRLMTREQLGQALAGLRGNIAQAVERMPAHADFLRQYGILDGAEPHRG